MKSLPLRARRAALPLAVLAGFPCLPVAAQAPLAEPVELRPSVVTATRVETRADALLSDVTVIDGEELRNAPGRTLSEVLARRAGLQMSSNGGLGKTASLFVRGTEARHVLLLVDGVRFGSSTTATPTLDNLPLSSIERIEILKGPASALYGSDAVGGVVQVFTRRGREGFAPNASVTLGSYGHRAATAGFSGGTGTGKSTLVNALAGGTAAWVAAVGEADAGAVGQVVRQSQRGYPPPITNRKPSQSRHGTLKSMPR